MRWIILCIYTDKNNKSKSKDNSSLIRRCQKNLMLKYRINTILP